MTRKASCVWDATALAAQLWCREDTEFFVMDRKLADEFVKRIEKFENDLAAELKKRANDG